jgi:hypothetical protein
MSDRELTGTAGLPVTTGDRRAEQLGYGAGWLTGALPLGMQADQNLVAFVTIIEEVASTLRAGADSISHAADVDVTSPAMVRYLGSWVGALALHSGLDVARQRAIVKATGATLGRRGTAGAITTILAALTDGVVDIDDDGGVFRTGRAPKVTGAVTVRVERLGHLLDYQLVELVLSMVPAHLMVTIECAGRTLYPRQEAS